jgi:cell division protein FtsQ
MARSLATRPGRSFAPTGVGRAGTRWRAPAAGRWRPSLRVFEPVRRLAAYGRRHRRLRRALLALAAGLAVLAGGWALLRHSSLVAVERVQISGVRGPDARAIEAALSGAARHMSTLDVRPAALRAAVAPFRLVRQLSATPSFPHGLHISVIEQLPVAAVSAGGQRTAVAADGVLLGPALLSGSLPTLGGSPEALAGQRLKSPSLLAAASILGAAPAPLAKLVARAFTGPRGLTVAMRNGLKAYFGDATRPHAKWLALARVLADPSAAGASYVDVRLPERPAAGFAAGTAGPAASTGSGTTATGPEQESATAALSTALAGAAGGGSSPATESAPAAPASTQGTPGAAGEAGASSPAQAQATPPAEAPSTTTTPGR